ncbi:probable serine/threonine-protein kinase DDB_G0290621 [Capricornis sumatraensis]|uniref:probable serine/threonine-protein kinase DDB_G0290621 n=1 Tax=Capricornis sumatraensis TaxID=34865 RepID=UPI003604C860
MTAFSYTGSPGQGNTWNEICDLTERLLKRFTNPKLRVSIITYSSVSNVLLPLTSDRNELKKALQRLRGIRPSGTRRLHDGLKMAGDEIAKVLSANKKAASMVYALNAGPLDKWTVWAAMRESNRLKKFKTKLYAIAMKNSQRNQLVEIVGGKTQAYEVPKPDDMEGFIISLVGNSCKQVMGGDTYYACVGEPYHLGFYAPELSPDKMSEYTCRYTLDKSKVYTKPPDSVTGEKLVCLGHVFLEAGHWLSRSYRNCLLCEPSIIEAYRAHHYPNNNNNNTDDDDDDNNNNDNNHKEDNNNTDDDNDDNNNEEDNNNTDDDDNNDKEDNNDHNDNDNNEKDNDNDDHNDNDNNNNEEEDNNNTADDDDNDDDDNNNNDDNNDEEDNNDHNDNDNNEKDNDNNEKDNDDDDNDDNDHNNHNDKEDDDNNKEDDNDNKEDDNDNKDHDDDDYNYDNDNYDNDDNYHNHNDNDNYHDDDHDDHHHHHHDHGAYHCHYHDNHHNHRKCSCPRAASVHRCHPEPGSSLVPYTCPVPGRDPIAAYLHLLLQEGHQGDTISPESKKTMPCTDRSDCLPL